MRKPFKSRKLAGACALVLSGTAVSAEVNQLSYNSYGLPGLIDMPNALSAPDGEIATTLSYRASEQRGTFSFQISPRLMGSLRFSAIDDFRPEESVSEDISADIRFRFLDEGRYLPAMAVGLRDFIGDGAYAGEYVVATKHIHPRLAVTAGLGWGRLASEGGFANPLGVIDSSLENRPERDAGQGGEFELGEIFQGDAAFFGGAAWAATSRLTLKYEYSSDAYEAQDASGAFNPESPHSFGVDYRINDAFRGQLYYQNGTEIGAAMTILLNPSRPAAPGGVHAAPLPVRVRDGSLSVPQGWAGIEGARKSLRDSLADALANEGIELEGTKIEEQSIEVFVVNKRYGSEAEAVGRVARILSQASPDNVERFSIIPLVDGVPSSKITVERSDLERLEHHPRADEAIANRIQVSNPPQSWKGVEQVEGVYPRFRWSLGPSLQIDVFNNDGAALEAQLDGVLSASYEFAPGLEVAGSLTHRILGEVSNAEEPVDSDLPVVRSDFDRYNDGRDAKLADLTLAYRFRPAPSYYSRITVGYLEPMFGGVSTELLWKPAYRRLALGGELNYAVKRDYEQGFDFQEYDVFTGHLSAYYEWENGYQAQMDLGRYLAEDWGSTLTLSREFSNGWRIGAWATLTDASFSDFGYGSFDKGIRVEMPISHILGSPSRYNTDIRYRPAEGDGGARLNVPGRLYEDVREYHSPSLERSMGRFWR